MLFCLFKKNVFIYFIIHCHVCDAERRVEWAITIALRAEASRCDACDACVFFCLSQVEPENEPCFRLTLAVHQIYDNLHSHFGFFF